MINNGLYTSNTDEWSTPDWLFNDLNTKYHFDLDVCATPENAKCKHYYTKAQDGLSQKWFGNCWMNPPYGRQIGVWIKTAYQKIVGGECDLVCMLLPARTDTAWWHDYCMKGEITFIRGRLKFSNAKGNAPFPSVIVILKNEG